MKRPILLLISVSIIFFICTNAVYAFGSCLRVTADIDEKRAQGALEEVFLESETERHVRETRKYVHDLANKIAVLQMKVARFGEALGEPRPEIMEAYPKEDQDRYKTSLSFYYKTGDSSLFIDEVARRGTFLLASLKKMISFVTDLKLKLGSIPKEDVTELAGIARSIGDDADGLLEEAEVCGARILTLIGPLKKLEKINLDEWHRRHLQPMLTYYARGIRTSVDIDPEITLWVIVSDLNRIFFNLISNSARSITARWGGQGGAIEIFARREDGNAVITVRDNGVGIDIWNLDSIAEERGRVDLVKDINSMLSDRRLDEAAQLIFEPWFSTKPGKEGGEGLGIVRDIVRKYEGGDITVYSAWLGEGATFTITLPLTQEKPHHSYLGSERTYSAEGLFTAMHGIGLFEDEALSAAKMIDGLGIGVNDNVLYAGPGEFWFYIIACALRGAKVEMIQSEWYKQDPNQILTSAVKLAANQIKMYTGIDVLLPRIDNLSYQALLQHANVPGGYYSYAFVLHVLDTIDDERKKEEFIVKLLSSLKDESYILIGGAEKEVRTLQAYGEKLGYDVEGPVDNFRAVDAFGKVDTTVFRLKVTRSQQPEQPETFTTVIGNLSQEPARTCP